MSVQESVQLKTIYQSTVTELGADVEMFAEEKMLILFNESAPKDLRDIAVSHTVVSLEGTIEAGDILSFDDQSYEITFVGGKVNETVSELGHCTIAFNGADHADLPGTMCVEEKAMPNINVSTKLSIIKK
ncbi:PTS glucitol/sorbitol transporter subunit IIA [Domibacillus sp. DTU_2020_1001157_1_SI_ALB_TIR_016]|uniref:PTS glucitol/sorbitol transporter subunit IIA n=1 Tax=Domibacillus sp. DTU_2020_1001157_1_SI_ALB_TIR_016 TaxID=3077789 RepID=UPI0028E25A1F|nr:PTS glucitol/sorbitol transporter subunit IIA [Domibacillus sp. DTU_2020_1001157_1_SI_ALB_TIR_016]WNS78643.1 PTS glucitol/sorbitol transporter subunit IIA [Domibacillus sp. DTU_2020_1001157_1_SI_ALB_TIR_016]